MTPLPFRHHDHVPSQISSPYYARLAREWVDLNADPSAAITVRTWPLAEPALAGHARPADVVDAIDTAPPARKDALLLALIRLTQGGEQLAGRIVLQAMLPKLGHLTKRTGPTSSDDAWTEDRRHIAVAHMWQAIADYPTQRRTARVAANLAMETLHQITEGLRRHPKQIPVAPEELSSMAGVTIDDVTLPGELPETPDLETVLRWALHHRVLTREEASLLAAVYLDGDGTTAQRTQEAANQHRLTPRTVRHKTSIARKRLAAAINTEGTQHRAR